LNHPDDVATVLGNVPRLDFCGMLSAAQGGARRAFANALARAAQTS